MNTVEFANAVDPAYRKHYVDRLRATKPNLEAIFEVDTQESKSDKYANYTGLGPMPTVGEGETYTVGGRKQGYTTTLTVFKKGEVQKITKEMIKYTKEKKLIDLGDAQADQVNRAVNKLASSVINNSQNTSYTSLSDGKPLVSTQHPRADGGTAQSNASSTGVDLTEANMETMQLLGESVLDDRGEEIEGLYMDTLLVPNTLRAKALRIVGSALQSGNANNDINIHNKDKASMQEFKGSAIEKLIVWKHLNASLGGSNTAWTMLSSGYKGLVWNWGEKPNLNDKNETLGWLNDSIFYKVSMMIAYGWIDFRGIVRSLGAGAAFSS